MALRRLDAAICSVMAFCLTGCSGLTQIQDTVTKFDQGAHSVSTTEVTFLKSAQSADCNYQFYTAAFAFANDPARVPKTPLTLETPCTPNVLPDQDVQTRQKLMDAITLYVDQIQALASTGSDKTLSTNAQTTATDLNNLAKNQGLLPKTALPIAAGVEAAVVGLSGMVLEAQQLQDIKSAASSQSANLTTVVGYLKTENTQVATNMADKDGELANVLDTTISQEKENGDPRLMMDILSARDVYQGSSPTITATVQQLNAALDSLVKANDAIAQAGTGGITAAVNDLVARAQAAQTMQAALNK